MPRERWDKRAAFILAAIGSAIGLGNVWRFPYVAYANGGGAFFIPYLIALITTGIPWALILILIIRGITLQGSSEGLDFYLRPDFSQLLNPDVWLGAYGQIFFSLSLGFGIMVAYASYLPKDSDINTNAWVVSFANCATSYFAGFAVFSVLGYLSFTTSQPIEEVVGAGPGLAFVIYPTAIAKLPGGIVIQSIFSIMFFLMLLTLGIDSAFSLVEAIVTGLKDSFNLKRENVTFWVCFMGIMVGFLYTTSAGLYWLDVVDHWMNWGLVIVGLLETVLIGWFFDIHKASEDMDSTSELKFGRLWVFSVKYLTPSVLLIIIMSSIYKELKSPYGGYPIWSLMVGGWILLTSLMFMSFIMQSRKDIPTMNAKFLRFIGWLIIYSGLIVSFYAFYTATHVLIPFIILVSSVLIGSLVISLLNKQKLSVSSRQEDQ